MRHLYIYGTPWSHYYPCPDCKFKPLSLTAVSNSFGSVLCVYLDGNYRYLIGVSEEVPYSGCNNTNYIVSTSNTTECVWKPSHWIISPMSNRFFPTGHYSVFIQGKGDVKKTTLMEPMKKYPFYIVPLIFVLGCVFGFIYYRHRNKKKQEWNEVGDGCELAPLKQT